MTPPQVLSGLFENLHKVRFLDINFKRTSDMADRLAEADRMLRCGDIVCGIGRGMATDLGGFKFR